jgi:putative transposase
MARLPRLVIPGIPYHVTQRGNRRQQTFFEEADYALAEKWRRLRMSETSGRPLGSEAWLDALEAQTGRALKPQKRGPKRRGN